MYMQWTANVHVYGHTFFVFKQSPGRWGLGILGINTCFAILTVLVGIGANPVLLFMHHSDDKVLLRMALSFVP